MIITIAAALYKKHHDAEKKNDEIKELAHDGNFTLPEKVPSIPENAEAGMHWRFGVDPAAKGAVQHDDASQFERVSSVRTVRREESIRTVKRMNSWESESVRSESGSVEDLWDEVASMVECPTPRPGDYGWGGAGDIRSEGSVVSNGSGLQRSMDRKMSVMSAASTDSWTSRYSQMTDGRRYSEATINGWEN